jgi:hypothetical protein
VVHQVPQSQEHRADHHFRVVTESRSLARRLEPSGSLLTGMKDCGSPKQVSPAESAGSRDLARSPNILAPPELPELWCDSGRPRRRALVHAGRRHHRSDHHACGRY